MAAKGTVEFMAPKMERSKLQMEYRSRLVALPRHDVLALGLSLAHIWSAFNLVLAAYPWIVHMTVVNPQLRITEKNAFAYLSVANTLETLREDPEEGKRLLEKLRDSAILNLSLHRGQRTMVDLQGPEGHKQAFRVLKALQDLGMPTPPETPKGELKKRPYSDLIDDVFRLSLQGLDAIILKKLLLPETIRQYKGLRANERSPECVPVCPPASSAFSTTHLAVHDPKRVSKVKKTPTLSDLSPMMRSSGIQLERNKGQPTEYLKHSPTAYVVNVLWASADGLAHSSLRQCVSTSLTALSRHHRYVNGHPVFKEESLDLQVCMWDKLEEITRETHYGSPWRICGALNDYRFPEKTCLRTAESAGKFLMLQASRFF
ncbi:uncharacterized protein LOC34619879 [Cyclospora cayetanensis]|uniref:Uncharacterized protein LOC34619879 n=1 Tax=Cyclospora cayetanensis TaxID=88456 RepID=A0A6P6RXY0_9EIME|nr:uncharacterized protein LOC34619879 [Cyclospora cayetanensis]